MADAIPQLSTPDPEQVERRAERQRTEKSTGIPERRVDGQVRATSTGLALPALPAVSDEESDQISIAYTRTSAAALAYGSAALKPMPPAIAADASIVPRMKRRLSPDRQLVAPHAGPHLSSPITLATWQERRRSTHR